MGYFSPDADVWLPGHAYIKRITCLWAVKNLLLCFVLLEANKMSRPSVLGEGFHCWCVLCTELEPTRQDLGFVSYPCSWLTPWHGDCLFWTKLSWGFFLTLHAASCAWCTIQNMLFILCQTLTVATRRWFDFPVCNESQIFPLPALQRDIAG